MHEFTVNSRHLITLSTYTIKRLNNFEASSLAYLGGCFDLTWLKSAHSSQAVGHSEQRLVSEEQKNNFKNYPSRTEDYFVV